MGSGWHNKQQAAVAGSQYGKSTRKLRAKLSRICTAHRAALSACTHRCAPGITRARSSGIWHGGMTAYESNALAQNARGSQWRWRRADQRKTQYNIITALHRITPNQHIASGGKNAIARAKRHGMWRWLANGSKRIQHMDRNARIFHAACHLPAPHTSFSRTFHLYRAFLSAPRSALTHLLSAATPHASAGSPHGFHSLGGNNMVINGGKKT